MENLQDDPTDKYQAMKRSLEWYSTDKEEEKRKEKEKKAKKKRQQEREETSAKTKNETQATEQEKADVKKSSFLEMLIDGDKPQAETTKEQRPDTKTAKSTKKESEPSPVPPEATASTAETQTNPAELSPDEEKEATLAYITARQIRLAAEASEQPADDEESIETKANQTFLQKLADKLRSSKDASTDEILDASADETIAETSDTDELGVENQDVVMDELGEVAPETSADEHDLAQEADKTDYDNVTGSSPPSPISPTSGGPPLASSGGASSGGFSGGDSGPPDGTPSFDSFPEGGNSRFVTQSASKVAETGSRGIESIGPRTASGGEFLLGAFVGYLFGRRRGRIKAESQAEPVKRELEQQVQDLQQKIESRETRVRSVARQKVETVSQPESQPVTTSSTEQEASKKQKARTEQAESHDRQSFPEETPAPKEQAKQPFARSAERAVTESLASLQPEHISQPSAHTKNETVNQPEHLPAPASQPERSQPSPEAVLALPLQEVLRGAEKVPYHGESLRDLYESGRISERTLRETYRESLRGHSFERQLEKTLQKNTEILAESPERLSRQASQTLASDQVDQSNQVIDNSSDRNPSQSAVHQENVISTDLPPIEIDPSVKNDQFAGLTPGQQATVGAVIGIVFVVIVLLFWPR